MCSTMSSSSASTSAAAAPPPRPRQQQPLTSEHVEYLKTLIRHWVKELSARAPGLWIGMNTDHFLQDMQGGAQRSVELHDKLAFAIYMLRLCASMGPVRPRGTPFLPTEWLDSDGARVAANMAAYPDLDTMQDIVCVSTQDMINERKRLSQQCLARDTRPTGLYRIFGGSIVLLESILSPHMYNFIPLVMTNPDILQADFNEESPQVLDDIAGPRTPWQVHPCAVNHRGVVCKLVHGDRPDVVVPLFSYDAEQTNETELKYQLAPHLRRDLDIVLAQEHTDTSSYLMCGVAMYPESDLQYVDMDAVDELHGVLRRTVEPEREGTDSPYNYYFLVGPNKEIVAVGYTTNTECYKTLYLLLRRCWLNDVDTFTRRFGPPSLFNGFVILK